jgi:lipopolysaccharide export system protein LptC
MGGLALGTYWLVRNTPVVMVAEPVKEKPHESDYYMRNFTIRSFDDSGKLKSELFGLEARHFPDTDTLEIDHGRIRSVDVEGRLTTATANRVMSNGDGSELQLIGNAVVVREASRKANGQELARMEFRGEFLHAFLNDEKLRSHKPVVLTRGADQFSGDTFVYDNLAGVVELKGRVKGLLMPKNAAAGRRPAP